MNQASAAAPIFPFGALEFGRLREIAEGLWVLPVPTPFPPGAVNAVIFDDGDGWTVLDTGLGDEASEALWRETLSGPLAAKPVRRLIASHHHPDHIGLAGWFQGARGAELWTTRTAWLYARMLQLDGWDAPPAEAERFHRGAGYDAAMMARWRERAKINFSVTVRPMPLGFRRIVGGEAIEIGDRRWRAWIGQGHAPEHLCLFCDEAGILVAADQLLPRITPNIGVYPTEPDADPLGDWLDSCARLREAVDDEILVLPGHGDPFRGARHRLADMIRKHHAALDRLEARLAAPRRAVDCFAALYRREIGPGLEGLATVEAIAHLNRLTAAGRAARETGADGVHWWRATAQSKGGDP